MSLTRSRGSDALPTELEQIRESLRAPKAGAEDWRETRIAQLEEEVRTLRQALEMRQQIGLVTGLLAQRYGFLPDQAWRLLQRLSNNSNVKVRDVARVLEGTYRGEVLPEDKGLAERLVRVLPETWSSVVQEGS